MSGPAGENEHAKTFAEPSTNQKRVTGHVSQRATGHAFHHRPKTCHRSRFSPPTTGDKCPFTNREQTGDNCPFIDKEQTGDNCQLTDKEQTGDSCPFTEHPKSKGATSFCEQSGQPASAIIKDDLKMGWADQGRQLAPTTSTEKRASKNDRRQLVPPPSKKKGASKNDLRQLAPPPSTRTRATMNELKSGSQQDCRPDTCRRSRFSWVLAGQGRIKRDGRNRLPEVCLQLPTTTTAQRQRGPTTTTGSFSLDDALKATRQMRSKRTRAAKTNVTNKAARTTRAAGTKVPAQAWGPTRGLHRNQWRDPPGPQGKNNSNYK